MDKKAKFIFIGFIGIIFVLGFFVVQFYNSRQQLLKIKQDLEKENTSLGSKLEKISAELRRKQDEFARLQNEMLEAKKSHDELQEKYSVLNKERHELLEQLKSLKSRRIEQPTISSLAQSEDAYWGEILKAKTTLGLELENARSELKNIQISNEQLERQRTALDLEITNLKRDKEDLKRQLEYNQKVTDSISAELARERSDKLRIESSFKPIKNENTLLRRQLVSLTNRKINIEKKLIDLQEQRDTLQRRFAEMEAMLRDKISSIEGLKEKLGTITGRQGAEPEAKEVQIELPPIVVRPQAGEPSFATSQELSGVLTGTILAVNRENNFVIIDLGESSGVKIGDTFRVYREGTDIATLEVIKTRESISACDIKKQTTPIKVADLVK